MYKDLKDKLERINWDFETRNIVNHNVMFPFNNRKLYSYPATFIPEIPFSLIEILSQEGDVVMDPFGGIGTTFVQALIQNRKPISIDNNSMASLVTSDFYVLFNPNIELNELCSEIERLMDLYVKEGNYYSELAEEQKELLGWYEEETLNEISFLVAQYNLIKEGRDNEGIKELFHICLSSLLTTACSQNGGWAYIADNVKPKKSEIKNKKALELFLTKAKTYTHIIQNYREILGNSLESLYKENTSRIICANFAELNINTIVNTVDLVVTSPPYPKMIDYVKSQRLSYYIEEKDFCGELKTEIGARARRNQKTTIADYVEKMKICNRKIYNCLKENGFLCYVLPDFSIEADSERKKAIDEVISDCIELGFKEVFNKKRCIPGTKRSNNIKWASLKNEIVIVLEKTK